MGKLQDLTTQFHNVLHIYIFLIIVDLYGRVTKAARVSRVEIQIQPRSTRSMHINLSNLVLTQQHFIARQNASFFIVTCFRRRRRELRIKNPRMWWCSGAAVLYGSDNDIHGKQKKELIHNFLKNHRVDYDFSLPSTYNKQAYSIKQNQSCIKNLSIFAKNYTPFLNYLVMKKRRLEELVKN